MQWFGKHCTVGRFIAEHNGLAKGRPALNGGLHHPAKAKRVVQLFMSGAASQCDTFDYKPLLVQRHGQKFDPGGKVELFQSSPGAVMIRPLIVALALVPVLASALPPQQVVHLASDRDGIEFFEERIRPLFAKRCAGCHMGRGMKSQLDLGRTGPPAPRSTRRRNVTAGRSRALR